MLDVVFEHDAPHCAVAGLLAESVEEVGIIEMGLILADVAEKLVDAAAVGRRHRAFVAASPFAEHSGGVAVVLHYLRQNHMIGVVGLLSNHSIVYTLAIVDGACMCPILLVAAHCCVSAVLTGHQACARRCAHRAAGVGLRE